MAYQRIATHPRIFSRPLRPEEASANVGALPSLPRARVVTEDEGFLDLYVEVTGKLPVRGNLLPDAHVATLLREHGARTLYTCDADFRKFAFLEIRDPLEA